MNTTKRVVIMLGLCMFIISQASATINYPGNSVVFNYPSSSNPTIVINSTTTNVNDSQFLLGYTWTNAPYPGALYSTYNSTYDAKISMDYPYVNTNILGNKTYLETLVQNLYSGNNSAWLSTFNSSYLTATSSIPTYNATYNSLWNNGSYLSTYNSTYDGFTFSNNNSIWSAITALQGAGNASWNQSFANTLYSDIKWNYNQTTPSLVYTNTILAGNISLYNASWTSTFNQTYANFAYNQTYSGATYNSTYDAKISMDYPYVNTNILGNKTYLETLVQNLYSGNNSAWLSTFNSSYLTASSPMSTFNSTYASYNFTNGTGILLSGANQFNVSTAYLNTLYIQLSNATINAGIPFWYNMTYSGATYNATYAGLINNASYLSTYNATYDGLIQWGYNQTTPSLVYANTILAGNISLYNSSWTSTYNASYLTVANVPTYNASYDAGIKWQYNQTTPALTNGTGTYIPYVGASNNINTGYVNLTLGTSFYNANLTQLGIGIINASMTLDVRGKGNFSGTVYINNNTDLSTAFISSTNTTINGLVNNGSYLSTYNASYDQWAYNQTIPAVTQSNFNLAGNISLYNSSWTSTYNASYLTSVPTQPTFNSTYASYNFTNGTGILLSGANQFNVSTAYLNTLYIQLSNATINAGIPFWYNMSDGSYNSSYNTWAYNQTTPALVYTNTNINGNVTTERVTTNSSIDLHIQVMNQSWLSTYNSSYLTSVPTQPTFNSTYASYNFTNGTGILLSGANQFNVSTAYLNTLYIQLSNATINAGIPFWYNMTYSGATYNATYNSLWNNGSYLSTYNASYQLTYFNLTNGNLYPTDTSYNLSIGTNYTNNTRLYVNGNTWINATSYNITNLNLTIPALTIESSVSAGNISNNMIDLIAESSGGINVTTGFAPDISLFFKDLQQTNRTANLERARIAFPFELGNYSVGMSFWTSSLGALTEKVRINAAGLFGLNTTNPSDLLTVQGTSNLSSTVYYNYHEVNMTTNATKCLTIQTATVKNVWC